MTRRLSLVVLFLAAVGCATAGDGKATPEALKPFQGKWRVIKAEQKGKPVPPEKAKNVFFVFAGNRLTFVDDKSRDGATVSVDNRKKLGEIDIVKEKNAGTLYGIFKLENGKLTMCFVERDQEQRPKEFATSKDGVSATLVVLEKVKD